MQGLITNHEEIIKAVQLIDLFTHDGDSFHPAGSIQYTECFMCGASGKRKGISLNKVKNVATCYQCSADSPITVSNYFTKRHNLDWKEDFKAIILRLSEIAGIPVQYSESKRAKKGPQAPKPENPLPSAPSALTFCERQLQASGLSDENTCSDVVIDKDTTLKNSSRYSAGSKDGGGNIIAGDDMILHYLTLDRKQQQYYRTNKKGEVIGKYPLIFTRIRYQFPEHHLDEKGKPKKYASPYGSGNHVWFPEILLKKYSRKAEIPDLHLHEGEKKADKATLHNFTSVGIGGISMLAVNKTLHSDIAEIVRQGQTKAVYFWLDADWQDIGSSSTPGQTHVDYRPRTFLSAIRNFKAYFEGMRNEGFDLKLYLCYVNPGAHKGIDDLLVSMPGDEEKVYKDWEYARNASNNKGEYVSCVDISAHTEQKLKQLFGLESKESFFELHKAALAELKEFMFGTTPYVYKEDTGTFELKYPITEAEQFWLINRDRENHVSYRFSFDRLQAFANNRLLGPFSVGATNERLITCDKETKTMDFINKTEFIRYIFNFLDQINARDVKDYFYLNQKFFEETSLMQLYSLDPIIKTYTHTKNTGFMFFSNGFWMINAQGITVKTIKDAEGYVWSRQVKPFTAELVPRQMVRVTKSAAGDLELKLSPEAASCHFLSFLRNTGNFKPHCPESEQSPEERYYIDCHLMNKLSGIGYMLHRYFNAAVPKSVVAIDSERKDQEDRGSYGGSGKSLTGDFIGHMVNTVIIDCKKAEVEKDKYLFAKVDEQTECIIMDDPRPGFDFEFLLSRITGNFGVRDMNKAEVILDRAFTPKFFIPINHSIKNADRPSLKRRIFYTVYSPYYNEEHLPIEDFGSLFFEDWENTQWNLGYNLAACCLQIYLEHGLIEAPGNLHIQKQQRGEIGDGFIDWANEYFIYYSDGTGEGRFEQELDRADVFKNYLDATKADKWAVKTAHKFWAKFKLWLQYTGFSATGLIMHGPGKDRIQKSDGVGNRYSAVIVHRAGEKPHDTDETDYTEVEDDLPF